MADNPLKVLESKITELIALCRELKQENKQLKQRNSELQRERKDLLERQQLAGEHINKTLDRLRKMEGGS